MTPKCAAWPRVSPSDSPRGRRVIESVLVEVQHVAQVHKEVWRRPVNFQADALENGRIALVRKRQVGTDVAVGDEGKREGLAGETLGDDTPQIQRGGILAGRGEYFVFVTRAWKESVEDPLCDICATHFGGGHIRPCSCTRGTYPSPQGCRFAYGQNRAQPKSMPGGRKGHGRAKKRGLARSSTAIGGRGILAIVHSAARGGPNYRRR